MPPLIPACNSIPLPWSHPQWEEFIHSLHSRIFQYTVLTLLLSLLFTKLSNPNAFGRPLGAVFTSLLFTPQLVHIFLQFLCQLLAVTFC